MSYVEELLDELAERLPLVWEPNFLLPYNILLIDFSLDFILKGLPSKYLRLTGNTCTYLSQIFP